MEHLQDQYMTIYKEICDIVLDQQFTAAQAEFLEANYKPFDDTDENKLEYTEIHGSFMYILEEIIETQLKNKFSEIEIEQFYQDFKTNIKVYQDHNQDVYDVLLSFIDFNKFKQSMIDFKKTIEADQNALNQTEGSSNSGSTTVSDPNAGNIFSIADDDFAQFEQFIAEDVNNKELKWRRVVDFKMKEKGKFSLVMYQRPREGTTPICKSELVFRDFNADKFVEVVMDPNNMKQPNVKEMRLVESIDDDTKIWFTRSKMPMMTDRTALMKFHRMKRPDGNYLFSMNCIERDDFPHTKDAIRMDMFEMSLVSQQGPDVHIVKFSSFDMKGNFPMKLLNWMMGSIASKGLNMIYDQLKSHGC